MPPRQRHKSSATACDQCNTRRVRCDEQGPPCLNCVARGLTCEYSQQALLSKRRRLSLPQPIPSPPIKSSTDHLLELQLMNHWTASTCFTVCHRHNQPCEQDERHFWQVTAAQDAVQHHYSLMTLFAVTSLHLHTTTSSPQKEQHLFNAMKYHNLSLETFRRSLDNVTVENCQAIITCSLAHFVLGIALSELDRPRHSSVKKSIISVLALFCGSKKILQLFPDDIKRMPVALVLMPKDMSPFPVKDTEFVDAIQRLKKLNHELHGEDSSTATVNESALDELIGVSIRDTYLINGALTGWLIRLEDMFIAGLSAGEVVATLSFMHWAVLFERTKSPTPWWSFRSHKTLLTELSQLLSGLTPEGQAAHDWCMDQIGKVSTVESWPSVSSSMSV